MPTSLVATALRAMGQSPTEMEIHEIIIKVISSKSDTKCWLTINFIILLQLIQIKISFFNLIGG